MDTPPNAILIDFHNFRYAPARNRLLSRMTGAPGKNPYFKKKNRLEWSNDVRFLNYVIEIPAVYKCPQAFEARKRSLSRLWASQYLFWEGREPPNPVRYLSCVDLNASKKEGLVGPEMVEAVAQMIQKKIVPHWEKNGGNKMPHLCLNCCNRGEAWRN